MDKKSFINRFLKYVSFETTSSETTGTHPSTASQFELANYLVEELKSLGIDNAYVDDKCYVYATLDGDASLKPLGFIAHMDTSPDASGKNVKAQIIEKYELNQVINLSNGFTLDPKVFENLNNCVNHTLITTDGTTLLGGDDKAGINIIMSFIEDVIKENINHPTILITFTPDEEIGEGADYFNYDYYKERNCDTAYTLDGGPSCYFNYENFNAAKAVVTITGKSIHPGDAYNKMVNAQTAAMYFHSLLPSDDIPEKTYGYKGFNHLVGMNGACEKATLEYIIRNHDKSLFEKQKELFISLEKIMNDKYGYEICNVKVTDQYYNMRELIESNPYCINLINKAYNSLGLSITPEPIRGGTDGARLTFGGINCPNLGTGDHNCHGPYEYLDVDDSMKMIDVLKEIIKE